MLWKIRFVKLRQLFFPSGYNLLFNYNQRICLYIIKICVSLMCEFEKMQPSYIHTATNHTHVVTSHIFMYQIIYLYL